VEEVVNVIVCTFAGMLRLPAEWEPQEAVQLTLPHEGTDWKPYLEEAMECFMHIAQEICKREKLLLIAPNNYQLSIVNDAVRPQLTIDNLQLIIVPTDDTWARDHAPLTLVDDAGKCVLLNFCFNGWGNKYEATQDNLITERAYAAGAWSARMEDHQDFVLEGGSIESDGEGTILTTTSCLLAANRCRQANCQCRHGTRAQVEAELLRRLRAKRVLWLEHGHIAGDDTDGHIDTLARFAPQNTILYVSGQPQMEAELRAFRTLQGQPYRLLPLPVPYGRQAYCPCGEHPLPATYANFLVINGAVLYPTYGCPDTDREAGQVIAQAFPDREIVPIDCRVLIRQNGSLHCVTMQYPKGLLSIVNC
jgi:agmatine/peptidylarginine deiminase